MNCVWSDVKHCLCAQSYVYKCMHVQMQNRTACSEECAIILFCCLFHYLFFVVVVFTVDLPLNYSPFVYALSTIIFKVKLSGYKSSNCVTESMRTITITNPTTSCIKSLHTITVRHLQRIHRPFAYRRNYGTLSITFTVH